ncbi:hypothetical protein DL95DRAFT_475451 [Leptodontidium sp. 2 PMI_412]|nr:hypothetical protein DL95DRAFT_475451 [Leptodontidium sp. 2 PMI_412]
MGGDSFSEVFESPQESSISMIACLPKRLVHLDFKRTGDSEGERKFYDFHAGKVYKESFTMLEFSKVLADGEVQGYWIFLLSAIFSCVRSQIDTSPRRRRLKAFNAAPGTKTQRFAIETPRPAIILDDSWQIHQISTRYVPVRGTVFPLGTSKPGGSSVHLLSFIELDLRKGAL